MSLKNVLRSTLNRKTNDSFEVECLVKAIGSTVSRYHLSACSAVNVYLWRDFFDFRLKEINSRPCLFAHNDLGCFMFLPPLGGGFSVDTIKDCFEYMRLVNGDGGISRIEHVPYQLLSSFPQDKYDHYKKGYEYLYFRRDIAELKGNKYKSKRWAYNNFLSNSEVRFVPYAEGMYERCAALYKQWQGCQCEKNSGDIYSQMADDSSISHRRAFKDYTRLGLVVRVAVIADEIVGYTVGYPLNKDVFCVFAEIADIRFPGLATFIFRQMCSDPEVIRHPFINVMDDCELPNLADTKMSFRPTVMVPSYVITKKER